MKWLVERHEYWWNFLLENVTVTSDFRREIPKLRISTRKSRVAGRGCSKYCEYNLNFIVQEQGHYDETVCHEICHAFAMRLMPNTEHGSFWYYLYNVVCKINRDRYHDYKIPIEKAEVAVLAACTKKDS